MAGKWVRMCLECSEQWLFNNLAPLEKCKECGSSDVVEWKVESRDIMLYKLMKRVEVLEAEKTNSGCAPWYYEGDKRKATFYGINLMKEKIASGWTKEKASKWLDIESDWT